MRPGRISDNETLLELNRRSTLTAYRHIFPPDRYPFPEAKVRAQRLIMLQSPQHTFVIAERQRIAVGFACYSHGSLDELYVVPEEWGRGVADLLHGEALAGARRGTSYVQLWVLAENHRARRFYETRGWRPDGRAATVPYPPYPSKLGYSIQHQRDDRA